MIRLAALIPGNRARCLRNFLAITLIVACGNGCSSNSGAPISPEQPPVAIDQAAQVKGEFVFAWNAYRKYAFGHDELKPLSLTPYDWYGTSLYLTPVDALDTLILMGLTSDADDVRALIDSSLSFDRDMMVKTFEINIRLLGGLLSAYQMTGDARLLALAQDLGNRLLSAFNSPTGLPYQNVNLRTGAVQGNVVVPAEAGTYILEFGVLSKLTGNSAYYNAAKRALVALFSRRSPLDLIGSSINVDTGAWVDTTSTVGAGTDSYYEYLLKGSILFGDPDLTAMWSTSINAIQKYLADSTSSGLWYRQVDMNTGQGVSTIFGAYDAYFSGELALSGDLVRARQLQQSAYSMWNLYGIEPVFFDYTTHQLLDAHYLLNPEIGESAYYLYYYTGDSQFQEMGRTILSSLMQYCRTPAAYAELSDVRTKAQDDRMESYFFAETLKYLYLLYSPRSTIDLSTVVFTTEAHPLRRTW
ncbi:MAG: glycoside hydrolase family 47 protein [Terriglobales bacterium]